ncbi:Malate dehydrogenase, cytoplasmic [Dichanthelium oligosanthes]|uniref:Malate dehydrogenase n=1 Tax=Dichanthelium oligosanthes TaxID=888268 RepID=A0A1E5UV28_9POAL|nr:Malate dehydrogenase, cytoplasmic [Dichanthelium oligosanthes]
MIARGLMLGLDQPVVLHMLDIPQMAGALNGVRMELVDAALPLLRGVVATSDEAEAFQGVNFAVLIGGWPRKEGMERKDLIAKNVAIYRIKIKISILMNFNPVTSRRALQVLVVANPANTNALVLKEFAPAVPAKNITCLTRLDHNRALGQISEKLGVHVGDVRNAIVWGNHSSTQFPDASHATARTDHGEKPVGELVADEKWLRDEFVSIVQQRGAAVIKARKQSSSLSAASAACDHMRDWILGTPKGTWVSMGVYSDGSYSVPKGIFYSFPVTCEKGEWSIVQGLQVDDFARSKMELSANELDEERSMASEFVSS